MTTTDKATRALKLMIGLRHREVSVALKKYGFSREVLDEGFRLLHAFVDANSSGGTEKDATVELLDGWENEWFPAVQAMLTHKHPAVAAQVFDGLAQASGLEVILSVSTLLDRLDAMRAGRGNYGAEGIAAQATLEARGFTDEVTAVARELLVRIRDVEPVEERDPSKPTPELAEHALWAWYLEWSRLARLAITSRRLLKKLGFRQMASGEVVEDVETTTEADEGADAEASAESNAARGAPTAATSNGTPAAGGGAVVVPTA